MSGRANESAFVACCTILTLRPDLSMRMVALEVALGCNLASACVPSIAHWSDDWPIHSQHGIASTSWRRVGTRLNGHAARSDRNGNTKWAREMVGNALTGCKSAERCKSKVKGNGGMDFQFFKHSDQCVLLLLVHENCSTHRAQLPPDGSSALKRIGEIV